MKAFTEDSEDDFHELRDWAIGIATVTADADSRANVAFIERSIASLLRIVRDQLGLEVIFVGEFEKGRRVFRPGSSVTESSVIERVQSDPEQDSHCLRLVEGQMCTTLRSHGACTSCRPEDGMGADIRVPVRFEGGSLYGVLCGFSFGRSEQLSEREIRRLEMAATAAARLIAQAEGHEVVVPLGLSL